MRHARKRVDYCAQRILRTEESTTTSKEKKHTHVSVQLYIALYA